MASEPISPFLPELLSGVEVLAATHPNATIPNDPRVTSGVLPFELRVHGWRHRRGARPVTEYQSLLRAAIRFERHTSTSVLAALS